MELIGAHPRMERVRDRVARLGPTALSVWIRGPTGAGKEVVARGLHEASGRSGAFVAVDCGALAPDLIESTLFGHERGAFTGAERRRTGLVGTARGGTFFLDEVGELPLGAQTRLLRLLESKTYRSVGGDATQRADIRVLAASWRDPSGLVEKGAFREDLYHRLAQSELVLPGLAERGEDVLLLFEHFLQAIREDPPKLSKPARALLLRHAWPGNVREVRNAAQVVAALCTSPIVRLDDLPMTLRRPLEQVRALPDDALRLDLPYMEARAKFLEAFQLQYVEAQLRAVGGNVSAAARASGMDRRSIQRILARRKDVSG